MSPRDGTRIEVRKTHKLYVGGSFPRSESGRTYEATDARGRLIAHVAKASRKDARDAVVAARKAAGGWAARPPYHRGQVLYRVAEVLEGRREQLIAEVVAAEGATAARARAQVDDCVDRWVWYAGWADKIAQVRGSVNAVAGPYFDFTLPEATGVVAVLAPQRSSLLGLSSVIAPAIVSGNAVVVVTSYNRPVPAVTLAEVLATSDVPGGVVNLLTGDAAELGPWLAAHQDVNGLDLAGAEDAELATTLEQTAADTLKRVVRHTDERWSDEPGLARMTAWLESKTVWHPVGT